MGVYYDDDADESALSGKTVAVLGYGIQGRAQALCLKDANVHVVVGVRPEGKSSQIAKTDGMDVLSFSEAAEKADIVCLLTPDMTHRRIFQDHIRPSLKPGKTLYFSHGLNISYGLIQPPKDIDVIMVAPKGPGSKLRESFLAFDPEEKKAPHGKGQQQLLAERDAQKPVRGVPCLVAVHQDATGSAKTTALALAKAMRLTKAGAFECTFDQETFSDLFGEQAVLCGGVSELIKAGFETLTQRGYPAEMAYFEVLHELKLITDLIQEGGLEFMWEKVSQTARYGGRTRGTRIITKETKNAMEKMLDEIENGSFAKEWVAEYEAGMPRFVAMKKQDADHSIEKVGERIRNAMKGNTL